MPQRVGSPILPSEPKTRVPRAEYDRLAAIIRSTPGPSPWYAAGYPTVEGPGGARLTWLELQGPAWATVLVPEGARKPVYGALGFACYVQGLRPDRLLVWHHHGPPLKPRGVRLVVLDTRSLTPLEEVPNLGTSSEAPTEFQGGVVAEVDLPTSWGPGAHPLRFPEPMRSLPEVLILARTRPPGAPLAKDQTWLEAVYVARPPQDTVEVISLDWWNRGSFDFGYEWITQVARDAETVTFVGDGIRILPFRMNSRGEFLGWIEEPDGP